MSDPTNAALSFPLSPRAPAFVRVPTFAARHGYAEPSRSEMLREQIASAQRLRGVPSPYR